MSTEKKGTAGMKWLLAGLSGCVCAVLGCLLAGWIASLCVEWYRISSFEGGAGYYVVFLALGGAFAGFAIGAITSLVVMLQQGNFARGFGASLGITFLVAALSLGLAWFFGDVPPTLRGDSLELLVELQSPPGWKPSVKMRRGETWIRLDSITYGDSVRGSSYGQIDWAGLTERDGRTIVPAAIFVYTSTGKRGLSAAFGDKLSLHFPLPLPSHPGEEFEQWSAWLPEGDNPGLNEGFRYRFRVMRYPLWQAQKEEERKKRIEAIRSEIVALPADAPLESWLRFQELPDERDYLGVQERTQRLHDVFTSRADELPAFLNHPNRDISQRALMALLTLDTIPDSAETPLRNYAARLAADLREMRNLRDARGADEIDASGMFQSVQRWLDTWERYLTRGKRQPPDVSPILAETALWNGDAAVEPIVIALEDYREHWKRAERQVP